jgi:sulfatase maturation enzyme AslB (radical SAM superfamily)
MPRFARIQIELTSRCNFKCEFCPDPQMTRPRGDMPIALYREVIDQIVADDLTRCIQLHVMGEPMLHPELVPALRYAKDKGLAIDFITNASAINIKTMQSLLDAGTDHVLLSVQTPDERSFALRQSAMPFARYQDNITSAIAAALQQDAPTKLSLSFLTTPSQALLPSREMRTIGTKTELVVQANAWLDRIVAKCGTSAVGELLSGHREVISAALGRQSLYGWNVVWITDRFAIETRVLGDWVHPSLTAQKFVPARIGACEGLQEHIGVLHNGDLVFCCVDYDGHTVFGNAARTRIKDALAEPAVAAVADGLARHRVTHPYCQRCLGDVTVRGAWVRQLGSVFYFRFLRERWNKKRAQAVPLLRLTDNDRV